VHHSARELGTEHGGALAQVGAEALPADLQVDADRASHLCQPNQRSHDPLAAFLVLLGRDQEQLRDLVHQDDDRHRADCGGQLPHVGDAVPLQQVEAVFHRRDQDSQQRRGVVRGGGQRRQTGPVGGLFDPALAVDADQRHR
jgi:hypothetical protein